MTAWFDLTPRSPRFSPTGKIATMAVV